MEKTKLSYDVAIIGGGSAGLASAIRASENGVSVIIIERDDKLGGILNQCIHNGFGIRYFKKELTGPEYARKFIQKLKGTNVHVMLSANVTKIKRGFTLSVISRSGAFKIKAKSIVLATGCREKAPASILLSGTRPAGVLSAGSAQKIVNTHGKMIGKNVVIVGSGDIGLIMARRLRYEGANVLGVYEILPYVSGLKRNVVQCLDDYHIPLYLSTTVVEVVGKDRVEGVVVAPVDKGLNFILKKKKFIPCDTVVLSIGLVPENTLLESLGAKQNTLTGGAVVDEFLQTSIKGLFSCGNVLQVHNTVDSVSYEAERAGENSAKYVSGLLKIGKKYTILKGYGIRYVNPVYYYKGKGTINIDFRSSKMFKAPNILVKQNGKVLKSFYRKVIVPAEMETIVLDKKELKENIKVEIEENKK